MLTVGGCGCFESFIANGGCCMVIEVLLKLKRSWQFGVVVREKCRHYDVAMGRTVGQNRYWHFGIVQ